MQVFFCALGFTHHQGSFLAFSPQGDVFIPQGALTEDAVRRGLRALAPTDRSNMNECARRSYQIEIEETEVDAMIDEKDKTAEIRKPDVDVRMIQRWPTGRSIFRDNASKHKSRSKRDDTI